MEKGVNIWAVNKIVDKVSLQLADVVDPEDPEADCAEECWTLCIDAAHDLGLIGDEATRTAKRACGELGYADEPEPDINRTIDINRLAPTKENMKNQQIKEKAKQLVSKVLAEKSGKLREAAPRPGGGKLEVIDPNYSSEYGRDGVLVKGPEWSYGFDDIKREFKENFETVVSALAEMWGMDIEEVKSQYSDPSIVDQFEELSAENGATDFQLNDGVDGKDAFVHGPDSLQFDSYSWDLVTPEEFEFIKKNAFIDSRDPQYVEIPLKSGNYFLVWGN